MQISDVPSGVAADFALSGQSRLSIMAPLRTTHIMQLRKSALLAIAVGGLIAGALDLAQASFLFGAKIPLLIAAGLLGRSALHGSTAIYVLGVLLHFFIAFSAAAVYYAASRWLEFLKEHHWCAVCSMAPRSIR